MMTEIWKQRVRHHQKRMMKYLKYIFNDHFVIVCLFLVGAMGYAYSNYLKTIAGYDLKSKLIGVVVFTVVLNIGKLATIIQPADAVFMLPKEKAMEGYFKQAKRRSLGLPVFIIVLTVGVLMPLLVASAGFAFSDTLYFIITLVILKELELTNQVSNLKIKEAKEWRKIKAFSFIFFLLINSLALFVNPIIGLLGAVILTICHKNWLSRKDDSLTYQWEKMIDNETNRMKTIYKFINLFTDIPALKGAVKRRAYLDIFLKSIKKETNNVFYYLFARAFLRGTEYSGLYVRLTIIAMLLSGLGNSFILSIVLIIVFLYLTGFQLLPLYFHFDNLSLNLLYPVKQINKVQALKRLLFKLMAIEGLLIILVSIRHLSLMEIGMLIMIVGVFDLSFCSLYLPSRINKMLKIRR